MRFRVSHLDQSNMKCRIVAVLILVAGHAMPSEPNGDDKQETLDLPDEIKEELKNLDDIKQELMDLPDDIKQELMDLSDVDKQKVAGAFVDIVAFVGSMQLIRGHKDEGLAQRAEQGFLEREDTEWWACDDAIRFVVDGGCGEDGCPVRLAANHAMVLGKVTFAGVESYARYDVQGLEREWHWCLQDEDNFRCSFVLSAGGDGVYYDFNAPSTSTRSDGHEIARPAGRFKCERFFPSD